MDDKLEVNSPLNDPIPDGLIPKMEAWGKDFAWLVLNEYCRHIVGIRNLDITRSDRTFVMPYLTWINLPERSPIKKAYIGKWNDMTIPGINRLLWWELLSRYDVAQYQITNKALSLLDKPTIEPKIFISYRHRESSALALAIEARLKYAGNHSVFIDKGLEPGQEWWSQLESQINQCDWFLLLVDQEIFKLNKDGVSWTKKEYDLARKLGKRTIAIIHPDVNVNQIKGLDNNIQHIVCDKHTAAHYEMSINQVLSTLGYSTY